MPASDQVYQTSISINGRIDQSISKGLQKIDVETAKIVKQSKAMGLESKKAFEMMSKGMSGVIVKIKELTVATKDLMLPLLGVSIAFKGLQSIGDLFQRSADKARNAHEAILAFKASTRDIWGPKRGTIAEQVFAEQTKDLMGAKGFVTQKGKKGEPGAPIYGAGTYRAIQDAMQKANVRVSEGLLRGILERAVFATGKLDVDKEELKAIATQVGQIITLQGARIPKEMLVAFGLGGAKGLAKMSGPQRAAFIEKAFGKYKSIEELIKGEPLKAEEMAAEVKKGRLEAALGAPLVELQEMGNIVSSNLEMAFLPALKIISEAIKTNLEKPMEQVKELAQSLTAEMEKIFAPSAVDISKGYKAGAFFDNIVKAWNEDVLPAMQRGWEDFTKWVATSWATLGKSDNPMLTALHDGVDKMLAAVSQIAVALAEFAKIPWDAMTTAAKNIGEAAKNINDAVGGFKGVQESISKATGHTKEIEEGITAEYLRLHPGAKPPIIAHAMGGIIATPQVGLIGEAGAESVIPLKQDANTLGILGSTLSRLGVNPFDPNAYGHEMFDSMRTVFGLASGAGGTGGPPGFSGMMGGIYYTEYGPSMDPPGSPDYDSNSYNRIGAWPGITGELQPGDVALGYGAQAFYGVSPGQSFMDTRGNTVRFADRSGSKNSMNEDVFRLAAGGIVSRKMLSWLGEAGKEAVIPLEGARGKRAMAAMGGGASTTHNATFNISVGSATDAVVDNLIEQLRTNFGKWVEDAHFEHSRSALT